MLDKKKIFILSSIIVMIISCILIEKNLINKFLYPRAYKTFVSKYSEEFNIDENLVYSIMKAESKFLRNAKSHKGAKGLMQISDITRDWAIEELELGEVDIFDPETNIKISCWYINKLFREFGELELVITSYNAGSGNVSKWLKNKDYSLDGESLYYIPFEETDNYLRKVLNNYRHYNYIY
ncbi:MAG: lytic transglycosylase domain-containing protein [Peptostreptococcaceae bacterium]